MAKLEIKSGRRLPGDGGAGDIGFHASDTSPPRWGRTKLFHVEVHVLGRRL